MNVLVIPEDFRKDQYMLAKEAAQRYGRMRQLCPEDVGALEERIREQLAWKSAAS